MSFSKDTKNSLCEMMFEHDCCKKSLLYGILLFANVFDHQKIKFITENDQLTDLTLNLLNESYGIEGNLYITEKKTEFPQPTIYYNHKITISIKKELEKLFSKLDYGAEEDLLKIKKNMFVCDKCKSTFLRGVFLSCGIITNPESAYHLEVITAHLSLSKELSKMLKSINIAPKITVRKSNYILYYKESERIEDFLNYIGAQQAAFKIMNKKILRDIRNNANRIANCETANIDKTVNAAQIYIEAIKDLISTNRISLLPLELQQTAYLRMENEDISLTELGELLNPPITKSGVNQRLKKILNFAQNN